MPIGIRVTDLPAAAGTLDDDDEFLSLEDGSLRRATRAQAGPKASIVQVTDTANQFTATNVEGVLAEIQDNVEEVQDNVDALVISGGGIIGTDQLPNETGFLWTTEPTWIADKVYVGTCDDDRGVWLQEWSGRSSAPELHRYFLGFYDVAPTATGGRDDHNPAGIAVAPGKPIVCFWSSHVVDNVVHYRISDQAVDDCDPGALTFGPEQRFELPANERTAYTVVMYEGDDIYVLHRTDWKATSWSLTKFPDWATGTPVRTKVFSSADQFYVKGRNVGGVIRCMVTDHPSIGTDNKVWYAEINLTTGSITKADGTVLGNMDGTNLPLAEADLDLVHTSSGTEKPWGFDVGYTATRELVFIDGRLPPNFVSTADYKYAVYTGGAWVVDDIAPIGDYYGGAYWGGINFVPDTAATVLYTRESAGTSYAERAVTADNGATWTVTAVDSQAIADGVLTRTYPVRKADAGTGLFDYIATVQEAYPTYDGAWVIRVRPLPLALPIRRLPTDRDPRERGLDKTKEAPLGGLFFTGTAGDYVSTPDIALPALGFRFEVDWTPLQWPPAALTALISKESSATTREFSWYALTDGKTGIRWSEDGSTALTLIPIQVPPLEAGKRAQLAVSFIPDANGTHNYVALQYRFAPDEPWTTYASEQTAPATSIFDTASPIEIGSRWLGTTNVASGIFHRAAVMTVGGGVLAEWRGDAVGPVQTDAYGNVWTAQGRLSWLKSVSYSKEWNGSTPFKMGDVWFWFDANSQLRRKVGSAPTSATDGPRIVDFTTEYNGTRPLTLGANYLWIDTGGNLRRTIGVAPASDAHGAAWQSSAAAATADFNSVAAAINTTGKFVGRMVWCNTHQRPHWTVAAAASSVWVDADGTTVHTPV